MSWKEQELDFEGNDPEIQMRLRWMENRRLEREFWTPDRKCLAWMQETTPDDSDMRWWNAQPSYQREKWRHLYHMANVEALHMRRPRSSFAVMEAAFDEQLAINMATDDAIVARFVAWIREDFKAGRPCSVSLENVQPHDRHWAEYLLDRAIREAGIPQTCLSLPDATATTTRHA